MSALLTCICARHVLVCQIIEEERKRMLAAHAQNLGLKHLPKGVLATEQDMFLFQGTKS